MPLVVQQYPELPKDVALTTLIAETLSFLGYRAIHALAPGYEEPDEIRGAMMNHTPNISALNARHKPVFFDVFLPGDPQRTASRWQLFASAAEQTGGEFHVIVNSKITDAVARFSKLCGAEVKKVWSV